MNPQSSTDVLAAVISIFPEFKNEWDDENPSINDDGSYSIHSVYACLLEYISVGKTSVLDHKDLKQLGLLINTAVAAGGASENAVSTCFLEHVKQIRLDAALKPFLLEEAKARFRA
jgi:hypothetical protein